MDYKSFLQINSNEHFMNVDKNSRHIFLFVKQIMSSITQMPTQVERRLQTSKTRAGINSKRCPLHEIFGVLFN